MKSLLIHSCEQHVDNLVDMWIKTLILLVLVTFSPVFAGEQYVSFNDLTWRLLLLEESKQLFCYGAGFGSWGEDARLVAKNVDAVWGGGSRYGPVIVYKRGIEYRWIILKGNSGSIIQGGVLFYAIQEEGYATGVTVFSSGKGSKIYVTLERGKPRFYKVDIWGNKIQLNK